MYGKNFGSRRKKNRKVVEGNVSVEMYDEVFDFEDSFEEEESDLLNGFVVYDNEVEEEESGFELDKKFGWSYLFIDLIKKK